MARLEVLDKVYVDRFIGASFTLKNLDTGKIINVVRSAWHPIGIDDYNKINIGDILIGTRCELYCNAYNSAIFTYGISNDVVDIFLYNNRTNDDLARISKNKLTWEASFPGDKFMNCDEEIITEKFNELRSAFPSYVFDIKKDDYIFTMIMETGKVKTFENAVRKVLKYYNKL